MSGLGGLVAVYSDVVCKGIKERMILKQDLWKEGQINHVDIWEQQE